MLKNNGRIYSQMSFISQNPKLLAILFILPASIFLVLGIDYIYHHILFNTQVVNNRSVLSATNFQLEWLTSATSHTVQVNDAIDKYGRGYDKILIHIDKNQIILPVWDRKTFFNSRAYLRSYSIYDGSINWQSKIQWQTKTIGKNDDYIYVFTGQGTKPRSQYKSYSYCKQNHSHCYYLEIIAFDIQYGKEAWANAYANMQWVEKLSINNEKLNIIGDRPRNPSPITELVVNAQTGETLIEPPSFSSPRSHNDAFADILSTLNLTLDDIVGEIFNEGEYIFFLTQTEPSLWAVNKSTREVEGKVQFLGESFRNYDNKYEEKGFAISKYGDLIIIYLGDSEQLFTFRFYPNAAN